MSTISGFVRYFKPATEAILAKADSDDCGICNAAYSNSFADFDDDESPRITVEKRVTLPPVFVIRRLPQKRRTRLASKILHRMRVLKRVVAEKFHEHRTRRDDSHPGETEEAGEPICPISLQPQPEHKDPAPQVEETSHHAEEALSEPEIRCRHPVQLSCGHVFGLECVTRWFDTQNRSGGVLTCPMCRAVAQIPQRCLADDSEMEALADLEVAYLLAMYREVTSVDGWMQVKMFRIKLRSHTLLGAGFLTNDFLWSRRIKVGKSDNFKFLDAYRKLVHDICRPWEEYPTAFGSWMQVSDFVAQLVSDFSREEVAENNPEAIQEFSCFLRIMIGSLIIKNRRH